MRITFVLPVVDLSGGNRVIAVHAQHLFDRGHTVTIVSLPASPPSLRDRARALIRQRRILRHRHHPASHLDGLSVPHRVIERWRPISDADLPDADVVIATWWLTAEWVARLSPSKGRKAYFVQGHERYDYLPRDRAEATYRLPMRKIAVSQWLVDLMRERYGDATSILVPNAVDHGVFNAAPRDKQAAPTVGMMYSEPRWKGCDISLHAVSVARQDILDLQLLAFGHGLSAALPLPAGAVFSAQPTAGQIRATYSQCDVWLFGAREEGFGLPILEAMACRTPVIGTPVGAAPELLADGAGILVSREDPHAMARAIVEVCRMENAAWRRLSDAAYARASQYSWDKASAKFEGALMEIAAGG